MRVLSPRFSLVILAAASLLGALAVAHADGPTDVQVLTIHAEPSTSLPLPIPTGSLDWTLSVRSYGKQVGGIVFNGLGMNPAGEFRGIGQINRGIVLVPMFPKLVSIKGLNLTPAGGDVQMTFAGEDGPVTEILTLAYDGGWVVKRGGAVANYESAGLNIHINPLSSNAGQLYLENVQFTKQ